jgi:alpha,alpha-trehalose phosphorylase
VIDHPAFAAEPWSLRETYLDLDVLAQTESLFALSNGHIGLRGNLDEGEPFGLPGTYLNSFYERRPLPYAEAGYGYPESSQTIVNVTNGKIVRLLVDDEPFDVRYGKLLSHERELDLRAGALRRRAEWRSPAGASVRVTSTRLVSLVQRATAAILYEVEALGGPVRLVVQSELVANEAGGALEVDPRAAAALEAPLQSRHVFAQDARVVLTHSTRRSGLLMAAGMDHLVDGPDGTETASESGDDVGRFTAATTLAPGERLRVVKFLAYGWSSERSVPAVRDQVVAALIQARHTGWDGLLAEQRAYLDEFWDRADVELEGDAELQLAVRFGLFHTLQAAARAEGRAIAAKGLTGPGYDGHSFWDSERYVLPVLTYTVPQAAGDALRWRHATLELARQRAAQLGLQGAAFPWRTIQGQECSGYWPAGTAAFHIGADIADAVIRHQAATGDTEFESEIGAELLVETARLWRSLGHPDAEGRFHIDGVTGPDEYSAIADDNVYTNLLAQRNLRAAAELSARAPGRSAELGVTPEEAASWRDAAANMVVAWDDRLGVHPQSEGFTNHQIWDFDGTGPEQYPLLLHFPYFDLYRKQVVKQPDLVLALHWCGDGFTDEEKARDFAYYEALTVRDSSLAACTQAVVAAEVGHLELAHDYFAESALLDLLDLEHNTRDGLHIAALAGVWLAAVAGFGGMRDHGGELSFAPRLPARLQGLAFRISFRGRWLEVEVTQAEATYTVRDGAPLEIGHHGERLEISAAAPVTRPIPALVVPPAPTQPFGRAPGGKLAPVDASAETPLVATGPE